MSTARSSWTWQGDLFEDVPASC